VKVVEQVTRRIDENVKVVEDVTRGIDDNVKVVEDTVRAIKDGTPSFLNSFLFQGIDDQKRQKCSHPSILDPPKLNHTYRKPVQREAPHMACSS
jgi:hypothetical protein